MFTGFNRRLDRGLSCIAIPIARKATVALLVLAAVVFLLDGDASVRQAEATKNHQETPQREIRVSSDRFRTIGAGLEHSCGQLMDGTIHCWGNNYGDGAPASTEVFRDLYVGGTFNCAVRHNDETLCWGSNNHGERNILSGVFDSIAPSRMHGCAIKRDGTIVCWGDSRSGRTSPPAGTFRHLDTAENHSCAIRDDDGSAVCWGGGNAGQLEERSGPFRTVAAGYHHNCGLLETGLVLCWGGSVGRLDPPAGIFLSISAGYFNNCGIKTDHTIACWGNNSHGQSSPPDGQFKSVSTHYGHTCAIQIDDKAVCWGRTSWGALEIPAIGDRITVPREPLVRGVAGDFWADVVIGKPDFSQIGGPEVVPFKVWNPGGVHVDSSAGRDQAYVWDSGNSRILGIDLAECYASEKPCHARIVLGQPSLYDHAACNGDSGVQNYPHRAEASAETLCGVPDVVGSPGETKTFISMVSDQNGNLYAPDSYNNRVLLYERPFDDDSVADAVWGQSDFAKFNCNHGSYHKPTASSLCFHSSENYNRSAALGGWPGAGVELDTDGNLWVADAGNNRVLRFPADPATGRPGKVADLVLGQADFGSRGHGPAWNELYSPGALRFGAGGQLYVADTYNNRVLVYEPPFTSGMFADREIGWGFRSPNGLETDPHQRGIWVNDVAVRGVSLWNWEGDELLRWVGEVDHDPEPTPSSHLDYDVHFYDSGGGIAFDRNGHLLIALNGRHHDVVRFTPPFSNPDGDSVSIPDMRWFYPPGGANVRGIKGLGHADGIALFRDQLIVADAHRLLFWNGLDTLTNGQAADGVIGDETYHDVRAGCCENIKADDAGRLWVNSLEGSAGFIDVYQLPLTHQAAPIATFSTYDDYPVLGTDQRLSIGRSRIWGIAPVEGGKYLWVTDTDNHRVLRFRDPLTNPVVDVILGQTSVHGNSCNGPSYEQMLPSNIPQPVVALPNSLCYPGNVAVDRHGNLWVSDHSLEINGNRRLLMFAHDLFPVDNETVLLAPSATKIFAEHNSSGVPFMAATYEVGASGTLIESHHSGSVPNATFEPAFDSQNRMVVGYNFYTGVRFVGVHDDPLDGSSHPTGYLNDFASMAVAAAFDDNDNLYVGDHNRARVLIYKNPFNNPQGQGVGGLVEAAPLPAYPSLIKSTSPNSPFCILRNASQAYQNTLTLHLSDLSDTGALEVQVRKLTDRWMRTLRANDDRVRIDHRNKRVHVSGVWSGLWSEYESTWATVRLLSDGAPITDWSSSFIVADDAAACAKVNRPSYYERIDE